MNNELIIESLFFVLSNPLKQSDLKKIFDTDKTGNPVSDIVDSYFICKYLHDKVLGSYTF